MAKGGRHFRRTGSGRRIVGERGDARWIDPAFYVLASLDPPGSGDANGAGRRGSLALRAGGSECGRGGAPVRRRPARRSAARAEALAVRVHLFYTVMNAVFIPYTSVYGARVVL